MKEKGCWWELIKNQRKKSEICKKKEKTRFGGVLRGFNELFWSWTLKINCWKLCLVQRTGRSVKFGQRKVVEPAPVRGIVQKLVQLNRTKFYFKTEQGSLNRGRLSITIRGCYVASNEMRLGWVIVQGVLSRLGQVAGAGGWRVAAGELNL